MLLLIKTEAYKFEVSFHVSHNNYNNNEATLL